MYNGVELVMDSLDLLSDGWSLGDWGLLSLDEKDDESLLDWLKSLGESLNNGLLLLDESLLLGEEWSGDWLDSDGVETSGGSESEHLVSSEAGLG